MDYNRLSCFSLSELLTMSPLALSLCSTYSLPSALRSSSLSLSPKLEDGTRKTTEINLSMDYVYTKENKQIDQSESKCGTIMSLLQQIDDLKCLSAREETPIDDNLFQFESDSDPITCVPTNVNPSIEMLPTYKIVVIRGQDNFQCRFIDCYFSSQHLDHLMEHQRTDHGVFECEQCLTLYFSATERDNCLSIHESQKIAQTDIVINQFSENLTNGSKKVITVEKRISNSARRLLLSTARAQAQLVAKCHLSVIESRGDGKNMILRPKGMQECPVCGKTFKTLTSAKAHFRFAHSVIRY